MYQGCAFAFAKSRSAVKRPYFMSVSGNAPIYGAVTMFPAAGQRHFDGNIRISLLRKDGFCTKPHTFTPTPSFDVVTVYLCYFFIIPVHSRTTEL